jgi:membrane protein YqaA with SNARE-associated domain
LHFEQFGLLGLFLSAFISSTIAPGGSEVVLAYLVNQHAIPVSQLLIAATIGNTLGALTTWGLGVLTARRYPSTQLIGKQHLKSLHFVQKWGAWALLFSWLPIVGDGFCFAGGWLRLSFISSLSAILLGKSLRYIAVAYVFI